MVTIKRTWLKQSQISDYNDTIDIWDSGSHIYERWSDGTEYYWKIIYRKEINGGIEEKLQKMPEWETPGQVLHVESNSIFKKTQAKGVLPGEFLTGGWLVSHCLEEPQAQFVKEQPQAQFVKEQSQVHSVSTKKKEQMGHNRHLVHHKYCKNKKNVEKKAQV
jgi:hypothetical protein